jgi:hypothetical protein
MTHLQKIITRAKAIRKAHPKKIWTDCIKAAAKELKKGAPTKKAVEKKAVAKKVVSGLDKVVKHGNKTNVEYSRKPKTVAKKKPIQGKLFGVSNSDFKKRLEQSEKMLATFIGNIAYFKQMQKTDKDKKNYWKVKATEGTEKVKTLKQNIVKLKKVI